MGFLLFGSWETVGKQEKSRKKWLVEWWRVLLLLLCLCPTSTTAIHLQIDMGFFIINLFGAWETKRKVYSKAIYNFFVCFTAICNQSNVGFSFYFLFLLRIWWNRCINHHSSLQKVKVVVWFHKQLPTRYFSSLNHFFLMGFPSVWELRNRRKTREK